jgi:uncharacterized protein
MRNNKTIEAKIIRSENFKTTNWAGGTSTELFVYPLESDYKKRNFSFRLSTAKVEVEKSEFTSLPGISRKIIVLDGAVLLNHENHHSKQLNKFDVDTFVGEWKTTSIGKCTDFNLMTMGETKGEISELVIEKNQTADYCYKEESDWLFMYVYTGKVSVELISKNETLNKGDLLVLKEPGQTNLGIKALEYSELVFSEILTQ